MHDSVGTHGVMHSEVSWPRESCTLTDMTDVYKVGIVQTAHVHNISHTVDPHLSPANSKKEKTYNNKYVYNNTTCD